MWVRYCDPLIVKTKSSGVSSTHAATASGLARR
jgi:hypothetical protein